MRKERKDTILSEEELEKVDGGGSNVQKTGTAGHNGENSKNIGVGKDINGNVNQNGNKTVNIQNNISDNSTLRGGNYIDLTNANGNINITL